MSSTTAQQAAATVSMLHLRQAAAMPTISAATPASSRSVAYTMAGKVITARVT